MTDAPPATSTSSLAIADALAERGNWLAAIDAWQAAAAENPSLRVAVERRLDWFLGQTGQASGNWRLVLPPVVVFLAATVLGTVFLLVAGEPGSTGANLWAAGVWVAIVVACVAALVAARRTGEASLADRVARARRAAARIEREPVRGELA